jgi:RHS repeat-associated protein
MTATVGGTVRNVVTNTTYQPFGPVTGWTYGNGLERGYNYDSDGRLTGVSTGTSGSVLQSLTYAYNANDVISKITNGANASLTQTYGYDALSRLTSMTATGVDQDFTYDANGNRTSHYDNLATDNYTIATTSNRLLSVVGPTTQNYSYTVNGNVVAGNGVTYTYDAFNRMSKAVKGGTTTTYWVNSLGQRFYKTPTGPGVATAYLYGPDGQLAVEYNWSGQGWTHYLHFGGELVGMVRGGQVYSVHTDHLGRPELATNSAKSVVWKASNYAFDRVVTSDSIGGLNLGFPGQYYDEETGNWNNGFRDYDARIGRYLETDQIGLTGGTNTYAYVDANPVIRVDSMGLEWSLDSSTGHLAHSDNSTGVVTDYGYGYAGHGYGVNNPSMQSEHNVGPLPVGTYLIGPQRDHGKLKASMRLTPLPQNNMYGRSAFLIHGPHQNDDRDSSNGCPIFPPNVRNAIGDSGDNLLHVYAPIPTLPPFW